MAKDGKAPVSSYASTGSTGAPVKGYLCPENGYYNSIRSLAQYFINGMPLGKTGSRARADRRVAEVHIRVPGLRKQVYRHPVRKWRHRAYQEARREVPGALLNSAKGHAPTWHLRQRSMGAGKLT
jgi:hypothetical protein